MKAFLTLLAVVASYTVSVSGEADGGGGYGVPAIGSISSGYDSSSTSSTSEQEGDRVRKYVSVHIAPEEGSTGENKVIRVPGGGNKHVNIIFVKTPSGSSNQKTEVILPEQDEQKNIVYVLTKKSNAGDGIKIVRPGPPRNQKPEVYFIRYNNEQGGGNNKEAYGAPAAASPSIPSNSIVKSIGSSYGAPF